LSAQEAELLVVIVILSGIHTVHHARISFCWVHIALNLDSSLSLLTLLLLKCFNLFRLVQWNSVGGLPCGNEAKAWVLNISLHKLLNIIFFWRWLSSLATSRGIWGIQLWDIVGVVAGCGCGIGIGIDVARG
jgi:hypothetical protein